PILLRREVLSFAGDEPHGRSTERKRDRFADGREVTGVDLRAARAGAGDSRDHEPGRPRRRGEVRQRIDQCRLKALYGSINRGNSPVSVGQRVARLPGDYEKLFASREHSAQGPILFGDIKPRSIEKGARSIQACGQNVAGAAEQVFLRSEEHTSELQSREK